MSTQPRKHELTDSGFVAPSFSVHGVQNSRVTLLDMVWGLIHVAIAKEDEL